MVVNGKFIKSDHDMSWFDVDPCWMIFTHFPKNQLDQMLGEHALSTSDYKLLPYLHPSYEEYGFEGPDLLSYFIHTGNCDFPKVYPYFGDYIEFVDIPITSRLQQNASYNISLIKKKDCHVAIVNERDFLMDDSLHTQWKCTRNVWSISFIAKYRGKLSLSIRDKKNSTLYCGIIEYTI